MTAMKKCVLLFRSSTNAMSSLLMRTNRNDAVLMMAAKEGQQKMLKTSQSFRAFSSKTTMKNTTYYSEKHEYIQFLDEEKKEATIGITDFAQNQLGDVVYVDLPEVGDSFDKGETFGSVESVKAASDVYSPASGKVVEINSNLSENPHLVNEAAMTEGWFIKMSVSTPSDVEDLMDEEAYKEHCENEDH